MRVEQLTPTPGKAILELVERDRITEGGLVIVQNVNRGTDYQPNRDFEEGVVLALGEGDWEPVSVGDIVLVRAGGVHRHGGGKAGSDISRVVGRNYGEVICVKLEEVVCKMEA